jgi:hypothetical protein
VEIGSLTGETPLFHFTSLISKERNMKKGENSDKCILSVKNIFVLYQKPEKQCSGSGSG